MIACLYDRLGGAGAVVAVVDDTVDRLASNPLLVELFCGRDLPQLKALGVSLLSARIGGPCDTGASGLEPSCASLRLNRKELHAAVGDMTEAMREQGIGAAEVGEVVRLIYSAGVALPLGCTAAEPIGARNDSRTLPA